MECSLTTTPYDEVVIISVDDYILSCGPLYVASILIKHGYSARVIQLIDKMNDTQLSAVLEKVVVSDKQILGISTTFARTDKSKQKLKFVVDLIRTRFPDIRIVVGGAHREDALAFLPKDCIFVMGQKRENEIVDTFNRLTGKIKRIPFDFKTFSIEYKSLFTHPLPGVIMFLEISQGCKFKCSFCSYNSRGTKSEFKSKDQVIREIEEFHSHFGTSDIYLLCNTFNDNIEKVRMMKEVADSLSFVPAFFAYTRLELLAVQPPDVLEFYRKYVKCIFFGVESFNPKSLIAVNKGANVERNKKFLIDFKKTLRKDSFVSLAFIVGLPHDSFDDHIATVKWLNENNVADSVWFRPLGISSVSGKTKLTDHSDIEIDPEKFGYTRVSRDRTTLDEKQMLFSSSDSEWRREDGYTSILAEEHSNALNEMLPFMLSLQALHMNHLFCAARGYRIEKIQLRQDRENSILSWTRAKAIEKEIENEIQKFVNEYVLSVM